MKTVGNQNMKALLNLAVGRMEGERKWRKKEINSFRGMGGG